MQHITYTSTYNNYQYFVFKSSPSYRYKQEGTSYVIRTINYVGVRIMCTVIYVARNSILVFVFGGRSLVYLGKILVKYHTSNKTYFININSYIF